MYLRCTIEKPEQHEEGVALRKGRGDDAEGVHERDDDENLLPAKGIGYAAPEIRPHHHANKDDRVQPSLSLRIQIQITFRRRQDEGHRNDVHLLGGADQSADGQQNIMELAITAQFDGTLKIGDYRCRGLWQGGRLLPALSRAMSAASSATTTTSDGNMSDIGGVTGGTLYVLLLAIGNVAIGLVAAIVRRKLVFRLFGANVQRVRLDYCPVIDMRIRVSLAWMVAGRVGGLVACCALVVVGL